MRIAFVSDSVYPWNVGGLETIERAEALALSKEHELHYFSLRWPGMQEDFVKDGIHYHTFHHISREKFYRHNRRSIREALVFAVGMLRIFRYKFDVIHSNEFPILQLPVLKLYCMLTGCKLIVYVHEVWDMNYWTTYIGPRLGWFADVYANFSLRMADHYIVNSHTTGDLLVGLHVRREKVTVFAPTVDDKRMGAIRAAKPSKEIIFAGRLIKEKRLDKWLQIVAKVAKTVRVKGLIVGDGPDKRQIENQIKAMKLQNTVEIRGFYNDKEKGRLFQRMKDASLFLHMSEREGLSTVALESIALGTPVLLPSYTPIPKDVRDMCIVADERDLPKKAMEIIKGKKEHYLPNRERIRLFYTSNVISVYNLIFEKLGISDRKS